MTDARLSEADPNATSGQSAAAATSDLAEEALVEEVSIDGMCGVY